jgi:hypothetical protein
LASAASRGPRIRARVAASGASSASMPSPRRLQLAGELFVVSQLGQAVEHLVEASRLAVMPLVQEPGPLLELGELGRRFAARGVRGLKTIARRRQIGLEGGGFAKALNEAELALRIEPRVEDGDEGRGREVLQGHAAGIRECWGSTGGTFRRRILRRATPPPDRVGSNELEATPGMGSAWFGGLEATPGVGSGWFGGLEVATGAGSAGGNVLTCRGRSVGGADRGPYRATARDQPGAVRAGGGARVAGCVLAGGQAQGSGAGGHDRRPHSDSVDPDDDQTPLR